MEGITVRAGGRRPGRGGRLHHTELGQFGEDVAARYLERRGLTVIDRNYRCPVGEIDIVAQEHGVLVVCEVKTRTSMRNGLPAEAVTPEKLARLRRLGAAWLAGGRAAGGTRRRLRPRAIRVDVVQVLLLPARPLLVRHLRGVG